MRGVPSNIYHHVYTFSFFLVFILSRPSCSTHVNTLSSKDSLTISSNRTIVSPGDVFELGFFKPASSSRWYLGIWYKNIPERTYVWVANRDKPLPNPLGTFKISGPNLANLVLIDQSKNIVWSTNLTTRYVRSPVVAELLANGNLVLRYANNKNNSNPSGFLWQSFDSPTDTLLPEMKLGFDLKTKSNRFLTSWRSPDDPSSGDFSYKLETRGFLEFFIRSEDFQVYRTGPWNGIRFSGVPEMQKTDYLVHKFTENKKEIAYTFLMTNHSIYSRLTLTPSGYLYQSTWLPEKRRFEPKDSQAWGLGDWSHGCVRKTVLSCRGDGFLRLRKMKLPDTTTASVDKSIGIKECMKRCLKNCSCTAFADADIRNGGSGCVIWTGELVDIRNYAEGGQDLYVRLASADLGY
ncbi:unnamed protein product [Microthlaspi erraticum]|uniref:Bulb-type lectin domain-containing protein n=1 Tax=Microthlaspi erraticum TaxID=1685480 RepID=A0A6D2KQD6_9BRAS|nr:unnamed protein product [Microthlaspi erraticum]